jgi:hypothetical protein
MLDKESMSSFTWNLVIFQVAGAFGATYRKIFTPRRKARKETQREEGKK